MMVNGEPSVVITGEIPKSNIPRTTDTVLVPLTHSSPELCFRWDNNGGAGKICKQLGYEEGAKGPRNAVSEGSGPIHAVSWASPEVTDDVINEIYSKCTHAIDQAVVCKGGLGPGIMAAIFIGPESDHCNACHSLTHSLTH